MAKSIVVAAIALLTFGSGVVNLYTVMNRNVLAQPQWLRELFPFEFNHLSRFLTLLLGFALIVSALNIYKRKIRAYRFVLLLSGASIFAHLVRGFDYVGALVSFALLCLLLISRDAFTLKSGPPDWRSVILRLGVAFAAAIAYGVAGFWLLDPREFGINFRIGDALIHTFRFMAFVPDSKIVPHTHHAVWFAKSLQSTTLAALVYSCFALFRPALYHFHTLPRERELARSIVATYGRSSQDFFKYWPDKSFFFLPSQNVFISYRVARNFAVALGDPVGAPDLIEQAIRSFRDECRLNDWGHSFYQVLPDLLPLYGSLGYRRLKIGDDAIVDLTRFTLEGGEKRRLRQRMNQFQQQGVKCCPLEPPLTDSILSQTRQVSDEWLQIPGRRERGFTLGKFEEGYVRSAGIFSVFDNNQKLLAFVNFVPSFRKGEATIDLMRHRLTVPNGTMDFLFIKLFEHLKEKGFQQFNLGMAPMSGFRNHEEATSEERAVHYFFQQLKFLFSFAGLRHFKAKFATSWEPRYVVYERVVDLPRLALALRSVSELGSSRGNPSH